MNVDLVILVDSSGSMSPVWSSINEASESLAEQIKTKCGTEARITHLSLDMKKSGSSPSAPSGFVSHEQFIIDHGGYSGPFATDDSTWDGEQGSKAVADISNHFPWKENACRSILYVGDEWLDSVDNGESGSSASISIGVDAANNNNVTVFTHLVEIRTGGNSQSINPSIFSTLADHYTQLAESTGGNSHIGDTPSKELYIELVSKAACECKDESKDITYDPCCPPFNKDRLAKMLTMVPGTPLTEPYKMIIDPSLDPDLSNDMQAYIDLHAGKNGNNSDHIVILFEIFDSSATQIEQRYHCWQKIPPTTPPSSIIDGTTTPCKNLNSPIEFLQSQGFNVGEKYKLKVFLFLEGTGTGWVMDYIPEHCNHDQFIEFEWEFSIAARADSSFKITDSKGNVLKEISLE